MHHVHANWIHEQMLAVLSACRFRDVSDGMEAGTETRSPAIYVHCPDQWEDLPGRVPNLRFVFNYRPHVRAAQSN